MNRKVFVLLIVLSLLVVLAGCSKKNNKVEENPEAQKNSLVQKTANNEGQEKGNTGQLNPRDYERFNGEGAVSMSFIFANPIGQAKKGYLTFVAALDNHSYNLDEYDLSKYVTLVDDKGNSPEGKPVWERYSGGGHHVINYLLFPDDGFITPETKYIKLLIKDFIDVPVREFVWEKEFLGVKE